MFDTIISRKNLHEAFVRVQDNGGCRGADGVTLAAFAARLEWELDRLEHSVRAGHYQPFPLLRFEIPKPTSGFRSLCVPTVRDRVLQTAVHLVVRPLFEAQFEEVSHAYRKGRSVRTAIHRIRELREQGFRWVVDADIDGFFDHVSHARLLAGLGRLALDPRVVELLARWVRAEIWDGRQVRRMAQGLPQGSVVSPLLANFFLDELDENLALFGQSVVRYSDDFVILCRDPQEAAAALELTDYLLAELELVLHREKTRTTSFDQGFQFLGAVFLQDSIFLPFDRPKPAPVSPSLPPPLDLLTYLELRQE
jgi:group II intron reverse transcriptase/maturase